jgi:hypothetical protein
MLVDLRKMEAPNASSQVQPLALVIFKFLFIFYNIFILQGHTIGHILGF